MTFSPDALIDRIVAYIDNVVTVADSSVVNEVSEQEGLVPGAVAEPVVPFGGSSAVPSLVLNQKWHGMTLNLARGLGMSLKIKRILELQVVGLPQGGWRLVASIKDRPQYAAQPAGSAPRSGGKCPDLESCAKDLAEQVLEVVNYRRLLKYYIKRNTDDAERRILEL